MSRDPALDIEVNAILAWWKSLYHDEARGQRGDAGARAMLRRAETPVEALLSPACQKLLRHMVDDLVKRGFSSSRLLEKDWRLRRVALVAALLCQRQDDRTGRQSFARALGPHDKEHDKEKAETGLVSPVRFQHLMAAMDRPDETEKLTVLRRVVLQAKGTSFDMRRFIFDLLTFSDRTRIRWTFDYHGTDRENPSDPASSETLSSERLETQE